MCNTCGCKGAETFEAKGYKGISSSKIQVLEKYIENGGQALDYHELPYHIQRQLEMGKVHELLYQDVNRWLQDNAPNPHHAMPSWLSAEEGRVRTMSGKPHTPRKLRKDQNIKPEEARMRKKMEADYYEPFSDDFYELTEADEEFWETGGAIGGFFDNPIMVNNWVEMSKNDKSGEVVRTLIQGLAKSQRKIKILERRYRDENIRTFLRRNTLLSKNVMNPETDGDLWGGKDYFKTPEGGWGVAWLNEAILALDMEKEHIYDTQMNMYGDMGDGFWDYLGSLDPIRRKFVEDRDKLKNMGVGTTSVDDEDFSAEEEGCDWVQIGHGNHPTKMSYVWFCEKLNAQIDSIKKPSRSRKVKPNSFTQNWKGGKQSHYFGAESLDSRNYLSKRKPYGYMMGGLSPTSSGKYRDLEPSRTKLYTFTYSAMKDGIDHLDEEGNQISVFAHTPKEALYMAIQDLRLRENTSIYKYHINPTYSLDNDYNRENRLVSFDAESPFSSDAFNEGRSAGITMFIPEGDGEDYYSNLDTEYMIFYGLSPEDLAKDIDGNSKRYLQFVAGWDDGWNYATLLHEGVLADDSDSEGDLEDLDYEMAGEWIYKDFPEGLQEYVASPKEVGAEVAVMGGILALGLGYFAFKDKVGFKGETFRATESCSEDEDCPDGKVCVDGKCLPICVDDGDCASWRECRDDLHPTEKVCGEDKTDSTENPFSDFVKREENQVDEPTEPNATESDTYSTTTKAIIGVGIVGAIGFGIKVLGGMQDKGDEQ